jgi:thioredoxin reductase (NADPH)
MGRLGIEKLVGVEVRDRRNQAVQSFELEALFECIGSEPVADFADGLKLSERGYILTDENLQTSLSGVFAAGEVRDGHFRQLVVVAAEGALSAHAACAFLDEA